MGDVEGSIEMPFRFFNISLAESKTSPGVACIYTDLEVIDIGVISFILLDAGYGFSYPAHLDED